MQTYVGLEAEATSISDYEPGVIPGLLQTADYAQAVHEGALPRLTAAVIDQRIEVRRTRQKILTRDDPPQLRAVIDEAVLHRVVGSPKVMAAQLAQVIEGSDLPNVTMRVLPYSAGAHPALDSTFVLLEFAHPMPGVVYVEGLVGQVYLERPQDVERYTEIFESLCALSLGEQASINLMAKLSVAYTEQ